MEATSTSIAYYDANAYAFAADTLGADLGEAQTPSNLASQSISAKAMCSTWRPVASLASRTIAAEPSKAVTR